jgi:ABC-type multidrug transport system ATPase subunit
LKIEIFKDFLRNLRQLPLFWYEKRCFCIKKDALAILLDEIEVHLHPHWQRKILPIIQDLFKNAQIFLTTHAPFIANSIDGATIYELSLLNGRSQLTEVTQSKSSLSYELVLKQVFGVKTLYGVDTQTELDQFYEKRNLLLQKQPVDEQSFLKLAHKLAVRSTEMAYLVSAELRQLSKITQKNYLELRIERK